MIMRTNKYAGMINTKRFRKLKTLHDIELEKARLKYDMLLAENRLMEDIDAVSGLFTHSSFFSRASDAFSYASGVYSGIQNLLGWFFRKKDRRAGNES